MLNDRHWERYADVLLWGLKTARRGRFKKGDVILIQYDHAALKLAEILYDRIIAAGMNPVQRMGLTIGMERSFYGKADGRQLIFHAPGEKEFLGNLHGRIYLHAPDSLTHLKADRSVPDQQGSGCAEAAARHPRTARPGRAPRLDALHPADTGTRGAGAYDPGTLRRADHPGLLSRPERPGRQMGVHPSRGERHQAMAGRLEDTLLPCRVRALRSENHTGGAEEMGGGFGTQHPQLRALRLPGLARHGGNLPCQPSLIPERQLRRRESA